jgi:Flp pilus assembly pilin Flp
MAGAQPTLSHRRSADGAGGEANTTKERKCQVMRLLRHETGQSFIEYALIILLIAIVAIASLLILGEDLQVFYDGVVQAWAGL